MAKECGTVDHSLEIVDKIKETRYLGSQLEKKGSRLNQTRADFHVSASQTLIYTECT